MQYLSLQLNPKFCVIFWYSPFSSTYSCLTNKTNQHVKVYYLIKVDLGNIYFLTLFKLGEIFLTNSQPWHDGCKAFRADTLAPTAEHLPTTQKINSCPRQRQEINKFHKSIFKFFVIILLVIPASVLHPEIFIHILKKIPKLPSVCKKFQKCPYCWLFQRYIS